MEELEKKAQLLMNVLITAVFVLLVFDLSLAEQRVGYKVTRETLEELKDDGVGEATVAKLKVLKSGTATLPQTKEEFLKKLGEVPLTGKEVTAVEPKLLMYALVADQNEPVSFFGTELPVQNTPLVLLLCMGVMLAYMGSTFNALLVKLQGNVPCDRIGSWLFFHPGPRAPILGGLWVFSVPLVHVITFLTIQSKFGPTPWPVYVVESVLFCGLLILANWCFRRAMATRRTYLALCEGGVTKKPGQSE